MRLVGLLFLAFCLSACRSAIREMDLHRRPSHAYFDFKSWGSSAYMEGGLQAWAAHVDSKRVWLAPPCEDGRVMVSIKITEDARIDSVIISKGLCELADQNALVIAKSSGPWKPAVKDSLAQDSWVNLPIFYRYARRSKN